MGGNDKKNEGKNVDKPKPPPAKPADDEVEDGDFATPKRGVEGDDDQPL